MTVFSKSLFIIRVRIIDIVLIEEFLQLFTDTELQYFPRPYVSSPPTQFMQKCFL